MEADRFNGLVSLSPASVPLGREAIAIKPPNRHVMRERPHPNTPCRWHNDKRAVDGETSRQANHEVNMNNIAANRRLGTHARTNGVENREKTHDHGLSHKKKNSGKNRKKCMTIGSARKKRRERKSNKAVVRVHCAS